MIKNENGKRERGNLEEDSEFMPLSKRINNIHLTQSQLNNGVHYQNGQAQLQNGESSQNHQAHNVPVPDQVHQETHFGNVNGHSQCNGKDQAAVQTYPSNFNPSVNSNGLCVNNHQQSHSHNNSASAGPSNCQPLLHNGNQVQNYVHQSVSSSLNSANISVSDISNLNYNEEFRYEPVLNQSANPHYYEQNRQLFQLYMERIQRYNLPPHPHFYSSSNNIDPRATQHHNHNPQI